jgi:ABC-type multidrug transport system ATPase subunit
MEPQIVIKQGMSIGYRSGWRNWTVPDLELAKASEEVKLGAGRHLLLARNGRGKTTLLKTLAGLLPAFSGEYSVAGQVQFIDEELRFDPEMRPDKIFNAFFKGEGCARAATMAERLELEVKKPYGKLSKGNRQKVTLIIAEVHASGGGAQVLLLDEPFSGLDFHIRDEVDAIWRENQKGVLRLVCVHPDEPTLCAESALIISGEKITLLEVEGGELDWMETRESLS